MLNKKLKEKFDYFNEIDKISSNENTKQSTIRNKDTYYLNGANNNKINPPNNFVCNGKYSKNLNKEESIENSFNNNRNNGRIENLKEKLPNQNKNILADKESRGEKNPEKFVFQFFFDDSKTSANNNKENNFDDNITFNKNNNKKSKVKGPKHVKYYRENKYHSKEKPNFSISAINNHLINYKSLLTRSNNTERQRHYKSKENSAKVNRIVTKLYNEGMQEKQKKELLYKENLKKKDEEYKKYSFFPNHKKNIKSKKNIKTKKLNENLYSKQIEWKKKINRQNSEKKKNEEKLYLSQFSFKPNITQEYIADDEDMIRRNLNDMNNYIIKRRNQIRYKRDDVFKLRDYKQNDENIQNDNKYREPLTERIYYRNKNGIENSYNTNNQRRINYTKYDFLNAVKKLHNEIRNLNL